MEICKIHGNMDTHIGLYKCDKCKKYSGNLSFHRISKCGYVEGVMSLLTERSKV
jgi:hypothetical protein